MIKTFNILNEEERKNLFLFYKKLNNNFFFNSYDEMAYDLNSEIFNYGNSLFLLLYENKIIGSIGVITKEVMEKQEVFVTNFFIYKEYLEKTHLLLDEVDEFIKDYENIKIKLGIKKDNIFLLPFVLERNYKEVYKTLIYKLSNYNILNSIIMDKDITFSSLLNNEKDYQRIHNDAFLNSPNGAFLSNEGLNELIEKNKELPNFVGLCFYKEKPIGIYEVSIKNNVGWIESIGVSKDIQGYGLGKYILKEAVNVLNKNDVIKLIVISSNSKAVNLYKKYGFIEDEIMSYWFLKEGSE